MSTLENDTAYKLVWKNEFLVIYANTVDDYLLADWYGVLDAYKAKKGCLAVLESLNRYQFTKVLNNHSRVTGLYSGAIDWVGRIWFSSMYDLGVKWFSWVYSPDFYTQISTDVIVNISSGVTIETFYNMVDAQSWLNQQKVSEE